MVEETIVSEIVSKIVFDLGLRKLQVSATGNQMLTAIDQQCGSCYGAGRGKPADRVGDFFWLAGCAQGRNLMGLYKSFF